MWSTAAWPVIRAVCGVATGSSIMVWGVIGLNVKLGPVIFQNLGPGRGNGVTAARYIDDR
jgi:hypothetical protein